MYNKIFLILSICIFLLGCKTYKKSNEISSNNKNNEIKFENNEKSKLNIVDHRNYNKYAKSFLIRGKQDLIFLDNFSQDELSEFIVELYVAFEVTDLKFIENFFYIKKLGINLGENIDNFESLNNLHNLESLDILRDSKVVTLPPITNINIKNLELLGGNIRKISSIANLKNLEFLLLNFDTNIEDIDTIFELYNLKWLSIYGNKSYLLDLTHIEKLQKLESLFILTTTQKGLNSLANLKQLKELDILSIIDIENISPLVNLPNLEKLTLYSIDRDIIMPLAASKSLKVIELTFRSEEDYNEFMNKKGKIFSQKGIYIPPNDWR